MLSFIRVYWFFFPFPYRIHAHNSILCHSLKIRDIIILLLLLCLLLSKNVVNLLPTFENCEAIAVPSFSMVPAIAIKCSTGNVEAKYFVQDISTP